MTPGGPVFRYAAAFLVAASLVGGGCRTWTRGEEQAVRAFNEGNALRSAGRTEAAAEAYREALGYQDDLHAARLNLALVLSELGRVDESERQFARLLDEDPQNLIVLRAAAAAARDRGDGDGAALAYARALAVYAFDRESLIGLAELLEESGHFAEAVEHRSTLVEMNAGIEERLALAAAQRAAGEAEEALATYEAVLVGSPGSIEALSGAAETAEDTGDFLRAVDFSLHAAETANDSGSSWWRVARIRIVELGDFAGGLAALESALDAGFDDEDAWEDLISQAPPDLRSSVRNVFSGREQP